MNRHGFSLVEVIVAAVILAAAVACLLYVFSTESGVVARTGRRIEAMDFTCQTLEELKNEVRPSWNDVGEPLRVMGWGTWVSLDSELGAKFSGERRYRVQQVAGVDKDTGYRSATVAVRWTEP